ncbi:major facilitator superfamily-domain-containing protein [Pisolithus orientalis]|uniref:major facilitator superfamily-domain-containing protein n=1 Tax=Pisolithus orientalis TaxID=936130 RepID=UPI00222495F0|nr:major facilitator superfamily-domain-containing protein [Pisolithus orientalis]KAI6006693.1 major facilitator superfamily-domain-containing protein [Pisolithus orientalis]
MTGSTVTPKKWHHGEGVRGGRGHRLTGEVPFMIIFVAPISSIGYSAAFAPRVEVYTLLACRIHKPGYFPNDPSLDVTTYMADVARIHDIPNANVDVPSNLSIPDATYDHSPSVRDYEWSEKTRERCTTDPEIQAIVAKLSATLVTTMGMLSCLTTGWWGSFSDRHGRRSGLAASMAGLILTDLTFILTANFVDHLPGGYWFLLIAFIAEGLLGSMPTGMAAYQAYIADTSDSSSRSALYAFGMGLLSFGFAVGPLVGGFVIHLTGTTLSVFILAYRFTLVLPVLYHIYPPGIAHSRECSAQHGQDINVARFLGVLAILLPRDPVNDENPLEKPRKDRSLLFLAICYGMTANFLALMPFVFQYVTSTFGWTSETVRIPTNYYFASTEVTRALVLTVLLPNDSYGAVSVRMSHPDQSSVGQPSSNVTIINSPSVELTLARCALASEVLACCIMATATSSYTFVIGTIIGSFSAAFTPISQALALEIYTSAVSDNKNQEEEGEGASEEGQGEMGRLFGVLSVLQALGQQIISPAMFGFVYSRTVALAFPQAIFVVTAICFMIAFVLLAFVKIPVPVLSRNPRDSVTQHAEPGV